MMRLDTRHYMAIQWLAQPKINGKYGGEKTIQDIADMCGVHRKTIWEWRKNPVFESELKKEMKRIVGNDVPDVLKSMVDAAVKDKNAKAAELILKTYGDMLSDKKEVEQNISINIGDREELMRRIQERKKRIKEADKEN